jgi:O-antigen ligase
MRFSFFHGLTSIRYNWGTFAQMLMVVLLTLPWLNPWSMAPVPEFTALLITWLCAAGLLCMAPVAPLKNRVWLLLGSLFVIVTWRSVRTEALLGASWLCLGTLALAASWGAAARQIEEETSSINWSRTLVRAFLWAALINSAIALLQYFGEAHRFFPLVDPGRPGQGYGNLRQRNHLASLLNIGVLALCWLHAHQARWRNTRSSQTSTPISLWVMAVVLGLAHACSNSRTGLVQLVALLGMGLIWKQGLMGNKGWRIVLVVLITYLIGSVLLSSSLGVLGRFDAADELQRSRGLMWKTVWELILRRPWLGWGWGDLPWAYHHGHFDPRYMEIVGNAHNLLLDLAVELGIPAMAWIMGLFGWMVIRQKPRQEINPSAQLGWGILLVILTHNMLEYPLWYGHFQIAFGIALGLIWFRSKKDKSVATTAGMSGIPGVAAASPRRTSTKATRSTLSSLQNRLGLHYGLCALGISVLLVCAWAQWDFWRVGQIYKGAEQRDPTYLENTVEKVNQSWLFRGAARFAKLQVTPITPANVQEIHDLAAEIAHYTPEPRTIEPILITSLLLGRLDEACSEADLYRVAYPQEYARWLQEQQGRFPNGLPTCFKPPKAMTTPP